MKTLQKLSKSFLLFIFVLCGCSEEGVKTEGYILKVEDNRILVAENITLDIFKAIKDKPMVSLDKEDISLIYFSYDDLSNLQVGNMVRILFNGAIDNSFPGQASALEIEVIK